MFPQLPDPTITAIQLRNAIRQNKRPAVMLHEFLSSGRAEANLMANTLRDNREVIRILTSPEGRKWLNYWLKDTLNYLQKLAEAP